MLAAVVHAPPPDLMVPFWSRAQANFITCIQPFVVVLFASVLMAISLIILSTGYVAARTIVRFFRQPLLTRPPYDP